MAKKKGRRGGKVTSKRIVLEEMSDGPAEAEKSTVEDKTIEGTWNLVQIIEEESDKPNLVCHTDGCQAKAVAIWASGTRTCDALPLCEDCQQIQFGGRPEGLEADSGEISPTQEVEKDGIHTQAVETVDDMEIGSDLSEQNNDDKTNDIGQDEEAETWEIIKVITPEALNSDSPIKCSTENCMLLAACVYVSNLAPTVKWYTCLDCQENDFGGWPDISELPIKQMTDAHKALMASKCSAKSRTSMPDFNPAGSPNKDPDKAEEALNSADFSVVSPGFTSGAVQNIRGGGEMDVDKKTTEKTSVTPSPVPGHKKPITGGKPSKQALEMHRKWQEAAESMGGPAARIIVSKPAAKKLVYDLLHEEFRPMNITQVHKELKAIVPSPVLKSCLDDMTLATLTNDNSFAESDDDEGDKRSSKPTVSTTNDPYEASLRFKSGKSPNTCLYYVDYNKALNGNGFNVDERSKLAGDQAKAKAQLESLEAMLKHTQTETKQLLSEPTNDEATTLLTDGEATLAEMQEQLGKVNRFKGNEKVKNQIKRRIDRMSSEWRKRRRLCMDFLVAMEEHSDGGVSSAKCLAGDGPIDIDSDEAVIKGAMAFAAKKRAKPTLNQAKRSKGSKEEAKGSGVPPSADFVGVKLDSQGCVERIYMVDKAKE